MAFRVVWRDPTQPGRQSLTFGDRSQADQTIKLLDPSGQRLTLAIGVANAIPQRTDLVFANAAGRPPRNNTFWVTHWTPAIAKSHNPIDTSGPPDPDARRLTKRPPMHDLRHTHASWMLAEGMDMFMLSRRLVYETYATTGSRYGHLVPAQQLNAAEVAAAVMGRLRRRPGPRRGEQGPATC
ncbi:MAG: tyrosine-type recombinase/integrase [Cellulomonas sp.]